MQNCRICKTIKPLDNFYFRKDRNKYNTACKACCITSSNAHYINNKSNRLEKMKSYAKLNKHKKYKYYAKNKAKYLIRNKKWRTKFIEINGISYNSYRRHSDISFKLRDYLRIRLNEALFNSQKTGSAISDLDCSIKHLKIKLQLKFHRRSFDGAYMTWDNYGEWHIDHIIPLASFDLTNLQQLKKACHYSNLQPLWAKDNWYKNRR